MPGQGDSSPPARDDREVFAYAVLRVVPRVERGERVNVGVILFCRGRDFLDVRVDVDERRLRALFPVLDLDAVRCQLDFIRLVCAGDPTIGPVARFPASERFGWLVSPASTVVQPSRVHTGLCADPTAALDRLLERMVRVGGG